MRAMVVVELCGSLHEATYRHEHMRMTADKWPHMSKLVLFVDPFVAVPSVRVATTNVSLFMSRTEGARCVFVERSSVHKFRAAGRRGDYFVRGAPNVCGSSVLNLLHITVLAPIILTLLLNFGKCLHPRSNNVDLHCESEKDEFWR
jgi:hypothetical protein